MMPYNNIKFDPARAWMKTQRAIGCSWESIRYANTGSEIDLKEFLYQNRRALLDLSIEDWYEILEFHSI